jgi:hypothetical protein
LAVLWVVSLLGCHPPPAPGRHLDPAITSPDPAFNQLFGVQGNGWTGGDGTVSISLPDGRSLWLFGDSFLGTVDPDGRRAADTPFIHNCALIQDGTHLTPLYGQRDGHPAALFQPADRDDWYWPGDGTVHGDHLFVFLHRFRSSRPGLWNWQWIGTDLAFLRLPGLGVDAIRPVPITNGIRYGAALLEHRDRIYIYGVAATAGRKQLHVARTTADDLADGSWQFFDGTAWSAAPGQTAAVLSGVSSQFSLRPFRDGFVLITMDARTPFSGRLVAYRSFRPQGPFHGPVSIYEAPEASREVAAYNPFVHPQHTRRGRMLISYNVNHLHDPDALFKDASLYRPRFIRVDLARLLPDRLDVEHEFGGRRD